MNPFLLKNMQRVLNAYLLLDPESKHGIESLQGKIVTIELTPLNWVFQLVFNQGRVDFIEESTLPYDVKITGTPLRLASMMLANDKKSFFADDLHLEGNTELGQRIIDLFERIDIDWEEYLSRLVGDIPAHQMGVMSQKIQHWLEKTKESFLQNTSDYLHEEAELFPPEEAVQDFFDDVDQLRMDLDRLEASIILLQQNIEETP